VRNWPLQTKIDGEVHCVREGCDAPILRVVRLGGPTVFNVQEIIDALYDHIKEFHL
jgi:hypothetical protein